MQIIQRDPWRAYLARNLWVPKSLVNVEAVKSSLNFLFTDSYTGQQRILALWKEAPHHIIVPRAFWDVSTLPCEAVDCRPQTFHHVEFKSRVRLDHRPGFIDNVHALIPTGSDVQRLSFRAMAEAMGGILQLSCGMGKTCIALEHIARNQGPALVVVDNTNLLEQWWDDIKEFLEVPGGVGLVMAGKDDWQGRGIVLATYQTLANRSDDLSEEFRRYFSGFYADEGHHISATTYSRCIDLIYGRRYSLTATPQRADGTHIIADFHIGRVLHKDLRPTMKPRIIFVWTGFTPDLTVPSIQQAVLDVNGEVHLSKVSSFFGQWRPWLWRVLQDSIDAVEAGRKVLVLSNSTSEVVNLLTLWTRGPHAALYSEIPLPTAAEVGEELLPLSLDKKSAASLAKKIERLWALMQTNPDKVNENVVNDYMMKWQQYLVYKKVLAELKRRRREFLDTLCAEPSLAGVMTYGVPAKTRQRFLDERRVVFAITKYGREGLDCVDLDTVLVTNIFSSKNNMQQIMGRPTRPKANKKMPVLALYVHEVGPSIGMSKKLQKHLRSWPHEEGGPFEFELLHYPKVTSCKVANLKQAFGQ